MLTATLSVTPGETALGLSLTVENESDESVELDFTDAQRAEFVAVDADSGEEVWRWSDGRMFGQVLGTETLSPGETLERDVEWQTESSGSYRIEGRLVANEHRPSAEMVVELE